MTVLRGIFDIPLGERWPVVRTGERAPIPADVRQLVKARDDGRCVFCGRSPGWLELDHIVPWSAAGPDTSSNLRTLCSECNETRSNFRTYCDEPATPVTRACDDCLRGWVRRYGAARGGRIVPGVAVVEAYCGTCGELSGVTDPARLL
jgi:hypothetical protein